MNSGQRGNGLPSDLTISTVWATLGFVAFLRVWLWQEQWETGNGIHTLLAFAVAATGLWSRRRWSQQSAPAASELFRQAAISAVGLLNWLGFLLLSADSLVEALPGVLVLVVSELSFVLRQRADGQPGWPWMVATALTIEPSNAIRLQSFDSDSESCDDVVDDLRHPDFQGETTPLQLHDAEKAAVVASENRSSEIATMETMLASTAASDGEYAGEAAMPNSLLRRAEEGRLEDGSRFFSGEIRVEMMASQKQTELSIGFCPPFEAPPDLEIELDDERFEVKTLSRLPGGARLLLSRKTADANAEVMVQWYASVSVHDPMNMPIGYQLP